MLRLRGSVVSCYFFFSRPRRRIPGSPGHLSVLRFVSPTLASIHVLTSASLDPFFALKDSPPRSASTSSQPFAQSPFPAAVRSVAAPSPHTMHPHEVETSRQGRKGDGSRSTFAAQLRTVPDSARQPLPATRGSDLPQCHLRGGVTAYGHAVEGANCGTTPRRTSQVKRRDVPLPRWIRGWSNAKERPHANDSDTIPLRA